MWDQKRTPSPATQQLTKVSGGSVLGWQGRLPCAKHHGSSNQVTLSTRDAGHVRNKVLLEREAEAGHMYQEIQ